MTYEYGMIACSYTQLALFALWQTDPTVKQKYLDAALSLANGPRCLSQSERRVKNFASCFDLQ